MKVDVICFTDVIFFWIFYFRSESGSVPIRLWSRRPFVDQGRRSFGWPYQIRERWLARLWCPTETIIRKSSAMSPSKLGGASLKRKCCHFEEHSITAALEVVILKTSRTASDENRLNFNHWLHGKLSFCQHPVQPLMKISSKWRHFPLSVYCNWPAPQFRDDSWCSSCCGYDHESALIAIM